MLDYSRLHTEQGLLSCGRSLTTTARHDWIKNDAAGLPCHQQERYPNEPA